MNNDENIILLNTKRLGRCHNYNHSINNNNDNPIPPHFNYEKQLCKDIDLVSERSRDKEGEQVKRSYFFSSNSSSSSEDDNKESNEPDYNDDENS